MPKDAPYFFLASAAQHLIWQEWDDVFLVYQPSSAETHVFNDTSMAILQVLQSGGLAQDELQHRVVEMLDVNPDELTQDDLNFALSRLEELGLIAHAVEAAA